MFEVCHATEPVIAMHCAQPRAHHKLPVQMYADTTFVLIIAADKGTGKSVRALRMAHILPENWCSFNSATSARAGMNGATLAEPKSFWLAFAKQKPPLATQVTTRRATEKSQSTMKCLQT